MRFHSSLLYGYRDGCYAKLMLAFRVLHAALAAVALLASAAPANAATTPFAVPATYRGRLPCADCAAIDATLTFVNAHEYAQRYVYIGRRGSSFVENGTWSFNPTSRTVTLRPAKGSPQYLRLRGTVLTQLDANGDPIESNLSYDLHRSPSVIALPTAAPSAKHGSTIGLESNSWELTELNGAPVTVPSGSPMPSLHFAEGHVSGSTGCNRLMGSYTVEGNKLKFKPLATSMMMCEATAKLEAAYLKMLETVTSYAIQGETLTLLAGDKAVAKFHPGGS